ncbi:alpha/beta hydrolase [soil metagenome]
MKREIEFESEGTTLRGWIETPDDATGPVPVICFAHGFSTLKEMFLPKHSNAFGGAGFASVVWDHANFGDSDGEPRYEVDPPRQVRGYRDAITFATQQPEIDGSRVGIWGTSYSGGHVLQAAAFDKRVGAVVSQVPFVSGSANRRRIFREEEQAKLNAAFLADREARARGEEAGTMEVFGPSGSLCALPSPEEYDWMVEQGLFGTDIWENITTIRSVEMMGEYEPGWHTPNISAPLLMIVARDDDVTPSDLAQDCFADAREPKKIIVLPCGHMEAYTTYFGTTLRAAMAWFAEHLAPSADAG